MGGRVSLPLTYRMKKITDEHWKYIALMSLGVNVGFAIVYLLFRDLILRLFV